VRFVDLSDLRDEGALLARIGSAFGVQLGVAARLDALLAALRSKNALLLLDNCEHVHAAIAPIAGGIAASCPGVVVLATSREALGVPGEVTLQLSPLALPPERATPTAAGVSAFGAVTLFVERGRAATSTFTLTDENARTVARVCRELEGIPLAIELAAARLRLFGIEELAARLVEHFRKLNLGRQSGGGGARQQTIRAMIAWSYDLLSEQERALFRRLGTFVGGWSVDAASVVCAFEPLDGWDILDLLIVLEGKSLVTIANRSGESGYTMLESLAEFAREQLEATGEAAVAAKRHAQYFREYVESADGTYWEQERGAFNDPVVEFDNLVAALKWMLEDGNDVAGGAATAAATMRFWFFARDEGRRWAQLAAERLPPGSDPAIEARLALGLVQVEALPAPLMRAAAERSVAYYRERSDPVRLAESLYQAAMTIALYFPEDRSIAELLAIEGLALARTLPSRRLLPFALRARAQTMDPADMAGRRSLLAEGLELSQEHCESPRLLAMFLMSLSELDFESGQHASATEYGRLAVAEAMRADTTRLIAMTKTNLAHYAVMLHDRETGQREAIDAIRQADETQDQYSMTLALHALACNMAGADDSAEAARLLGFCDTRFGASHPPRQGGGCEETIYRYAHSVLLAELGHALLEREMRAGAMMSIDDVLDVAYAKRS
jgi:predicted ATPase